MRITARIANSAADHRVVVATDGNEKPIAIAAKRDGRGSSINGGELLLAALGTCACNDLFREGRKRGVSLDTVEVEVHAQFPAEGAAAENVEYSVTVSGAADEATLRDLVQSTDLVAEIQNTLRAPISVILTGVIVR